MSKNHRLSRTQRRKKEVMKRRREDWEAVRPYDGRKYQAPEYCRALNMAEQAINQCDAMTGREMTDQHVEQSLEYLVLELRGQKPARLPHHFQEQLPDGTHEDLIAQRIRTLWHEGKVTHAPQDLSGILRTIWQSVRTRHSVNIGERGYLDFLRGFLGQLGQFCERFDPSQIEFIEGEENLGPILHISKRGISYIP